jgi:uncharacterized protein (DUF1800 family)
MFPTMPRPWRRSLPITLVAALITTLFVTSLSAEPLAERHRGRGGGSRGHKHHPTPTPTPTPIPPNDAARFLNQATFGATTPLLGQVQQQGFDGFLSAQFAIPATPTLPRVDQAIAALPTGTGPSNPLFQEAWWYTVVNAPDQLRQRVAFALSEIMVVSANGSGMYEYPEAMATYWDLLAQDAFGNFRQILEDVTLNPAMGDYLDMVHNDKPDPRRNTAPNENYAREVMQLFTIGLYQLNPDGSLQLDGTGQPIPTYNQDVVEGYAHLFTGWYWAQTGTPTWGSAPRNYRQPMMAFPEHHDTGPKTLLNGVTLPAGQTQDQDLKAGLDLLFNHPNVGPFIARRLIQRLVTSNPSPSYISRVAAVFNNNGHGVRGDLKATVQAILLDSEARSSATAAAAGYGHEREPLIRLANLYRAFNANSASGKFNVGNQTFNLGQAALYAPSVFNFFAPDYSQAGAIEQAGLVSPEFQITTDTTVITSANRMRNAVYQQAAATNPDLLVLDLSSLLPLANDPASLVDSLNPLLMGGGMSTTTRNIVVSAVSQISPNNALERAQTAVHLLVTSPEFAIER